MEGGRPKKKDYNIVGSVMGSPNFVEMATLLLTFSGRSRMRRVNFGLKVFDRVELQSKLLKGGIGVIKGDTRSLDCILYPVPFLNLCCHTRSPGTAPALEPLP